MSDQERINESMMEQVGENDVPVPKVYSCPHCDCTFDSAQALAGHCKNEYCLPPEPRHVPAPPSPPPPPAPAPQQPIALPQLPDYECQFCDHYGQYYHHDNPYVPGTTQFPPAAYSYEPVTFSTRVTALRGGLEIENYEQGSSSNGGQARGEPAEENNEDELDLTLRL